MSQTTTWEYATSPLLTHATKQILDQWGADGWELVAISHESNYAICYTMFWKKEIFD